MKLFICVFLSCCLLFSCIMSCDISLIPSLVVNAEVTDFEREIIRQGKTALLAYASDNGHSGDENDYYFIAVYLNNNIYIQFMTISDNSYFYFAKDQYRNIVIMPNNPGYNRCIYYDTVNDSWSIISIGTSYDVKGNYNAMRNAIRYTESVIRGGSYGADVNVSTYISVGTVIGGGGQSSGGGAGRVDISYSITDYQIMQMFSYTVRNYGYPFVDNYADYYVSLWLVREDQSPYSHAYIYISQYPQYIWDDDGTKYIYVNNGYILSAFVDFDYDYTASVVNWNTSTLYPINHSSFYFGDDSYVGNRWHCLFSTQPIDVVNTQPAPPEITTSPPSDPPYYDTPTTLPWYDVSSDYITDDTGNNIWQAIKNLNENFGNSISSILHSLGQWFKDLGDKISNLVRDIGIAFTDALDRFIDSIQSLFIPNNVDLVGLRDSFDDLLADRFGVLYQSTSIVTDIFSIIRDFEPVLSSNYADYTLSLSSLVIYINTSLDSPVSLTDNGGTAITIIPANDGNDFVIDFGFLNHQPYSSLYMIYRAFVYALFFIALLNFLKRQFEIIMAV